MAIRNLFGLNRGKTQSGRDCLRGTLRRELILRDPVSGRESIYPAGSTLMLLRNDRRVNATAAEYHVAIICDDEAVEQHPPAMQSSKPAKTNGPLPPPINQKAVREANAHDREHMGINYIPY